jgi:hypothetical protein
VVLFPELSHLFIKTLIFQDIEIDSESRLLLHSGSLMLQPDAERPAAIEVEAILLDNYCTRFFTMIIIIWLLMFFA